jgi:hypothetical protein
MRGCPAVTKVLVVCDALVRRVPLASLSRVPESPAQLPTPFHKQRRELWPATKLRLLSESVVQALALHVPNKAMYNEENICVQVHLLTKLNLVEIMNGSPCQKMAAAPKA